MSVGAISGVVGTYATVDPRVEELVCAQLGLRPRRRRTQVSSATVTPSSCRRSPSRRRRSTRSRPRSGTSRAPRCARCRSRSPRVRRARARCRTSGTRSRRERVSRARAGGPRERAGGARERGAVARARHLALLGRARDPARRDAGCSTSCCDELATVVDGLRVYPERMRANLEADGGLAFSQSVLLALVDAGIVARRRVPDRAARRRRGVGPRTSDFRERARVEPRGRAPAVAEDARRAVRPEPVPGATWAACSSELEKLPVEEA